MQLNWIEIFGIFAFNIILVIVLINFVYKRRRTKENQQQEVVVESHIEQTKESCTINNVPKRIVIGEDPLKPAVTIKQLESNTEYEKATPLDINTQPISKMNELFNVVPSLLIAGEIHGKKIMEVIIDGELVRASDGNGFRAFVMEGNRIKEQAKLYEPTNFKSLINAAAVWQIASVIVAQKHLADISKKLDEILEGIRGISLFLDNQRKSRIKATYDYLAQVYYALQAGEFPISARNELENCERDMLEIQHHLEKEYQQKAYENAKDEDTFGSESLTNNINKKIDTLNTLMCDIELCIKTRIAGWYVMSLFPGDSQLKSARRESIYRSIQSYDSLLSASFDILAKEICGIYSLFNNIITLQERRTFLISKLKDVLWIARLKAKGFIDAVTQIDQQLSEKDCQSRIMLEFDNGVLVGVRKR